MLGSDAGTLKSFDGLVDHFADAACFFLAGDAEESGLCFLGHLGVPASSEKLFFCFLPCTRRRRSRLCTFVAN